MEAKRKTFLTHPTTTQFWLVTVAWALGCGLLALAITDFFKDSFFRLGYLMMYVLMATSTMTAVQVWFNYFRRKTN